MFIPGRDRTDDIQALNLLDRVRLNLEAKL
jgi:hypothetical protein